MSLSIEDRGKLIKVFTNDVVYEGYLLDISETNLKLKIKDSGYNIVLSLDDLRSEILEDSKIFKPSSLSISEDKELFPISFITTGGSITSLDSDDVFSKSDLLTMVPELSSLIYIKNFNNFSSKQGINFSKNDFEDLASLVYKQVLDPDVKAIIITHDSTTITWLGSLLSFMIENPTKPIVLVASEKTPNRAGFDGAELLVSASHFIKKEIPGFFMAHHSSLGLGSTHISYVSSLKKIHTSRADGFRSLSSPLAKVSEKGDVEFLRKPLSFDSKPNLTSSFSDKVALIKVYLNSDPEIISWYIGKGYKALVIEALGSGSCPVDEDLLLKNWLPYLNKALDRDLMVVIASQSFGSLNKNNSSLKETNFNFINNHNMISDVLYLKLAVAFKKYNAKNEILSYLETNISGEICDKELPLDFEK